MKEDDESLFDSRFLPTETGFALPLLAASQFWVGEEEQGQCIEAAKKRQCHL